jgi:cell division protein FtsW
MNQNRQQTYRLSLDYIMLIPVIMLIGIGLVMIYSASCEIALKSYKNEYYFFFKQAIYAAVGLVVLLICRYIPYRWYRPLAYMLLIVALVMLSLVLISGIGHSAGGARRWFNFGAFYFQPVEFAKFAVVLFLAYSLTKKQDQVENFWVGFAPHVLLLVILSGLIIMQPDFGSIAILWMLTWVMMFAGGVRLLYLVSTALMAILPAAIYLMFSSGYRTKRLITFLDPWQDPLNSGYQIIHSLMAFGSGGIFGKGFGQGYQKLFYLPTPHTDFIFSVIGEEGGLVWVLFVVLLFVVILWRGISIAKEERDYFGSLLALGLTISIALQAIVNMGVNLSLLPTKGLTLPFLSYGGTALVINMAFVGILMNIWAYQNR